MWIMNTEEPFMLVDFNRDMQLTDWAVVDDVVMGGRSDGRFFISGEGHAVFEGAVSLENNGGFSSIRYRIDPLSLEGYSKAVIRLKGDGKRYQFRIRAGKGDSHSYARHFETSGLWESVEIPLNEMFPTWRGMKLNIPNYPGKQLSEIGFLISNKRAENFLLQIDYIQFQR